MVALVGHQRVRFSCHSCPLSQLSSSAVIPGGRQQVQAPSGQRPRQLQTETGDRASAGHREPSKRVDHGWLALIGVKAPLMGHERRGPNPVRQVRFVPPIGPARSSALNIGDLDARARRASVLSQGRHSGVRVPGESGTAQLLTRPKASTTMARPGHCRVQVLLDPYTKLAVRLAPASTSTLRRHPPGNNHGPRARCGVSPRSRCGTSSSARGGPLGGRREENLR
jgi:hypothetical protein